MPREPAGGRRRHRRVQTARREADDHAEGDLELRKGGRLARHYRAEAEQDAAQEHDGARAEPVGERAPEERTDAHAEEVEEGGRRDVRARPACRRGQGLEEDPEREHRPEPDTGDDDPRADDDPAVEDLHGLRPYLKVETAAPFCLRAP
jgi:hypothetical protein